MCPTDARKSRVLFPLFYIRQVGSVGFKGMESIEDMRDNWNRLIDVADLTPDERREAVELFRVKVSTVPGTQLDRRLTYGCS